MNLSKSKMEKFMKWLAEKWGPDRKCPLCRMNGWQIEDLVVELPQYQHYTLDIGAPLASIPLLALACKNCGNTILISGKMAGVVD